MSTLHVRNVPDELYQQIQRQAQEQNRSISAQVIYLLERAVEEDIQGQSAILDTIRRRRFYRPNRSNAPDSLTLLRQDRAR
jgi:hypothetical protein